MEGYGVNFPFKHKDLGTNVQVLTTNGLTWFVKTGCMLPNEATGKWEEEQIAYPWEKFINQFVPITEDGKEFIKSALDMIWSAYLDKKTMMDDYYESLNE